MTTPTTQREADSATASIDLGKLPISVLKALHAAVAAIYFDDNSDYRTALYAVVQSLAPGIVETLGSEPRVAWEFTDAASRAAPEAPTAATDQPSAGQVDERAKCQCYYGEYCPACASLNPTAPQAAIRQAEKAIGEVVQGGRCELIPVRLYGQRPEVGAILYTPQAATTASASGRLPAQEFLNWNRKQETPLVAIGKEMGVFRKAMEFAALARAPLPTQAQENP